MAEELEIGIAPAVFSSSGKRNLSSLFSRRNRATSLCRTWKILDSSVQNWSGVGFWSSKCSSPRASEAGAAAEPPCPEFPLSVGMCQISFAAGSKQPDREKVVPSISHADGLSLVDQVTQVLGQRSSGGSVPEYASLRVPGVTLTPGLRS